MRKRRSTGVRELDHAQICEQLGVDPSLPRPDVAPYVVQLTRVQIEVEGRPTISWGGAMKCGQCGFRLDIQPEAGKRCPKCGWDGVVAK